MYLRNGPTILSRIFQQGGTDNLADIAAKIFNAHNVRSYDPAIQGFSNFTGPLFEIGRAINDVVIVQPELPGTLMHLMGLPQGNGYQLRFQTNCLFKCLMALHPSRPPLFSSGVEFEATRLR